MSAITGKRKRHEALPSALKKSKIAAITSNINGEKTRTSTKDLSKGQHIPSSIQQSTSAEHVSIQIVTGSYERVLHGIAARIPLHPAPKDESSSNMTFTDTFLFTAHTSAVRCLAISPPTESAKRTLATGGSDDRINLYSISTVAPPPATSNGISSLLSTSTAENPRNRSLGTLLHHDRAITTLEFLTKAKLFSAAEDNTIAISRTRDWTMLSSIKAPIPKPQGRPSGDTAGPGELPTGVNAFAIHPSQKLMLSVGRREKCMRLWNLMTGKKAGVLSFSRDLLTQVGEGKYGLGEGRRVLWDPLGESYIVGFERGAAVFGIDSRPQAVLKTSPAVKLHQLRFLPQLDDATPANLLAASTEDGRIVLFDITVPDSKPNAASLPLCRCVAQLGGPAAGTLGRVKDFDIITLPARGSTPARLLIVAGSSDGAVRLWTLSAADLAISPETNGTDGNSKESQPPRQIGTLISTLETGHRITCLGAFVMDGEASAADEKEEESEEVESSGEESE